MNHSSMLIQGFFFLAVLPAAAVLLLDAIGRAVEFGKYELPYRDGWLSYRLVRRDLKKAPLGRWIKALGLDVGVYAQAVPSKQLRLQIDSCGKCPSRQQCGQDVACRANLARVGDYCPNAKWVGWFLAAPQSDLT